MHDSPLILAIESSCDDTAAAVLSGRTVLSNVISSQKVHQKYGGVVPELASRAHQQNIVPVVHQALAEAKVHQNMLSAIAFTRGPGLIGSLLVGAGFAKSLSLSLQIPLIEVNHMQAHIFANFIEEPGMCTPQFPFLCLTVSGGHTQIVRVDSVSRLTVLGQTRDDAAGEAFDKIGKLMGLPYPAGPVIDKLAQQGDPTKFSFTKSSMSGYDYSFSGLKTGAMNFLNNQQQKNPQFIQDNLQHLCASVQETIVDMCLEPFLRAAKEQNITHLVLAGGVSANSRLRHKLLQHQNDGYTICIPPLAYTTDNAAMIGITAYYKYLDRQFTDLYITPQSRYSL
ncbi:MAG: tRNA (adenosine(37)-N6)-threonylcarbamoyltransferase complex transferase subunit TsaD [Weeksellaceae bacterium]|nr:tRNA (adenosine(37)-N6)-threonylcarbamoyltransferase complex transferase subunit TsaD [Weeksellaceae bacterium]